MEALQEQLAAAQAINAPAVVHRVTAQAQAAQVLADLAAAQAATGGPTRPVAFALSPALATITLINYGTVEGIKLYGRAWAPLDNLFNGDSASLRLFLYKVQTRATQSGWTAILQISNQAGQVFDFIENYGQITIAAIRVQATALEAANSRNTQNSSQMYAFLITSINDELLGKVMSQKEQYTSVGGFQDGPSLLKLIVTILHVDTRAQAGYIRQCLARLSITVLTAEYNCDIQKLNEHVIVLEEGLTARGETSQDTMMNVQAAYMVCKDADFVRHAKDEYARWEQGANMSLKEYTNSCLLKYKTLIMKGVWEAPSPEQEQIIALTAAVSSLKFKAKSGKTKTS
jgi:hypothetical protein